MADASEVLSGWATCQIRRSTKTKLMECRNRTGWSVSDIIEMGLSLLDLSKVPTRGTRVEAAAAAAATAAAGVSNGTK